ncbi:MAG: hypothetical protein QM820_60625 [Minicystis sp.]
MNQDSSSKRGKTFRRSLAVPFVVTAALAPAAAQAGAVPQAPEPPSAAPNVAIVKASWGEGGNGPIFHPGGTYNPPGPGGPINPPGPIFQPNPPGPIFQPNPPGPIFQPNPPSVNDGAASTKPGRN